MCKQKRGIVLLCAFVIVLFLLVEGEFYSKYEYSNLDIPLREFFESIGATVIWNEKERVIEINRENWIFKLRVDNQEVFVNKNLIKLSKDVYIKDDMAFIPIESLTDITDIKSYSIDELWNRTVFLYLQDKLWENINIYDAGHYLMVPLHAAFLLGKEEWQRQFSDHFKKFMNHKENISGVNRLNKLHYYYLISRFIVLAKDYNKEELIPENLADFLYGEIMNIWYLEPAWQWGREPFPNMEERIKWKLDNKNTKLSYYRAIIDEELFTFAIAADLYKYYTSYGDEEKLKKLEPILKIAFRVFKEEVIFIDNGNRWLFQPGVWHQHPDYAYAGNMIKEESLNKKIVPDIGMDSSHSHRFPLWLKSLAEAYTEQSPEKRYYEKLIDGLAEQFVKKVLVYPTKKFPGYRTNNFMDGRNGIYRWGYVTQGVNNGYGPYELSGTFLLGWWAFLGDYKIKEAYREMGQYFPLVPEVLSVYIGPGTSRERHSIIKYAYINGYVYLLVKLAGELDLNLK